MTVPEDDTVFRCYEYDTLCWIIVEVLLLHNLLVLQSRLLFCVGPEYLLIACVLFTTSTEKQHHHAAVPPGETRARAGQATVGGQIRSQGSVGNVSKTL